MECKYNQKIWGQVIQCDDIEDCDHCRWSPDMKRAKKATNEYVAELLANTANEE